MTIDTRGVDRAIEMAKDQWREHGAQARMIHFEQGPGEILAGYMISGDPARKSPIISIGGPVKRIEDACLLPEIAAGAPVGKRVNLDGGISQFVDSGIEYRIVAAPDHKSLAKQPIHQGEKQ